MVCAFHTAKIISFIIKSNDKNHLFNHVGKNIEITIQIRFGNFFLERGFEVLNVATLCSDVTKMSYTD